MKDLFAKKIQSKSGSGFFSFFISHFSFFISSLLLACLLFSCVSGKKGEEDGTETEVTDISADQPADVDVMRIQSSAFNYELISNGTITAMRKADLRFQTSENISRIYVKNGQYVSKGQKIAELDKFKLESAMEQARDYFERSKLDLQDILIGQGYSLNDTTRIPAEILKIAKVKSNYDQSLINKHMAEYNLNNATLYAPFSGVVANLFVREFNLPGGDPFCSVIDNLSPEVSFMILESELPLVKLNDNVIVAPFAMTDYSAEGKVTEINPVVDRNGMVRVKARLNNKAGKLYEGMNVKVRIQRYADKCLIIPKSALVLRTNRKVVFTLKNNRAMWNYVQTAQENSESYVITEGLSEGDSVIYSGNINLANESPVKVITVK